VVSILCIYCLQRDLSKVDIWSQEQGTPPRIHASQDNVDTTSNVIVEERSGGDIERPRKEYISTPVMPQATGKSIAPKRVTPTVVCTIFSSLPLTNITNWF
jgi:hypothetical protein